MHTLTAEGLRTLEDVAQRHGFGLDAVVTLTRALIAGNGSQAQFDHPELGGMGQWSQGGMIMIGDMFNNGLKYRIDALCNELAPLARGQSPFAASNVSFQSQRQGGYGGVSLFVSGSGGSGQWWPEDLGAPSAVGAQNDLRYAFFPATRRLAIRLGDHCTVYDTGDHQIGGFSQQQGGDQSLTFTSQYGLVRVADLPRVGSEASPASAPAAAPMWEPAPAPVQTAPISVAPIPAAPVPVAPPPVAPVEAFSEAMPAPAAAPVIANPAPAAVDEILSTIERLAALRDKGILTDDEFSAKKTDLLSRL